MIETLDDIIEELANQIGIYGAERRSPWTSSLASRIRTALDVDNALTRIPAEEDSYIAWARYTNGTIRLCDSDSPGAFRVYRHPA